MPDGFGLKFENNFVKLEISLKRKKDLNLGPKRTYLGIFGLEF